MDATLGRILEILVASAIATLGSLVLQNAGKKKSIRENNLLDAQAKSEKAREEDTLSGAALKMYREVKTDLDDLRKEFTEYQAQSAKTIRELSDKNMRLERQVAVLAAENKELKEELRKYKEENGYENTENDSTDAGASRDTGAPGPGRKRRSKRAADRSS